MKKLIAMVCIIFIVISLEIQISANDTSPVIENFAVDKLESYNNSVVKIIVDGIPLTEKKDDVEITDLYSNQGSGFFVEGNLIITTAHIFLNPKGEFSSADVHYKYPSNDGCFEAEIVSIDIKHDVCILKPIVDDFINQVPLKLNADNQLSSIETYYGIGFPSNEYSIFKLNYSQCLDLNASVGNAAIKQVNAYKFLVPSLYKIVNPCGFSGGIIVNQKGEIVCMEGYSDKNTTSLFGINLSVINPVLQQYIASIDNTTSQNKNILASINW